MGPLGMPTVMGMDTVHDVPHTPPDEFAVALAGAGHLLELVSGGSIICDPAGFPLPVADAATLALGVDDGMWPEQAA